MFKRIETKLNMNMDDFMRSKTQAKTNELPIVLPDCKKMDNCGSKQLQQNTKSLSSNSQQTNIAAFFPVLLQRIFSYLSIQDLGRVVELFWQNLTAKLNNIKSYHTVFASFVECRIKKMYIASNHEKIQLPELVKVVPHLEVLDLTTCYFFDADSLYAIFSNDAPWLVSLNLSHCGNLNDNCIYQIVINCKNLKTFELDCCYKITDLSLALIACGLKKLNVLSVSGCEKITDSGIKYIVGLNDNELSVGNCLLESIMIEDCNKITDAALEYLSNGRMAHLKLINLNYCKQITDAGLKHLSKISSLLVIQLQGCSELTDLGMEYLAQGKCKLNGVDISSCEKITSSGIISIVQALC